MATTNAQTFTIGGVTHQVEDTTARAGVASLQTALASLRSALDTLMGTDDITDEIDTYNEIKDFLDGFDVNDPTLVNQLLVLSNAIAAKYTKPETGIPATDLAQAVRDLLALAGTAVQPSALNGYVTTSTLNGYYTKSEVDDLIPDISGKANKSEMAVADNGNGTVTITLKTGTSATVLTQHQSLAGYALSSSLATVATSGSYNDLSNKPTIPGSLSQLSDDATHRTVTDAEKTAWGNKQNALTFDDVPTANSNNPVKSGGVFNSLQIPVVEVEDTDSDTEVTQALNPNTFYDFTGDDLTMLDITLVAGVSGCLAIYAGKFTAHANGCTFSYPNTVTAADSVPQIEGGETYEFNIMDGVLMMVKL